MDCDDYGDEWGQDYGQEDDGWGAQDEEFSEPIQQKSAAEASMLAQIGKCPKSPDGKFIFITYDDVLKLFPIKIKSILEEYGLAEVVTED